MTPERIEALRVEVAEMQAATRARESEIAALNAKLKENVKEYSAKREHLQELFKAGNPDVTKLRESYNSLRELSKVGQELSEIRNSKVEEDKKMWIALAMKEGLLNYVIENN